MRIIILGKRDKMGTMPVIRLKGMSRLIYPFEWDKDIRHYAYAPKNQRECDDIFRTQNVLYKTMRFSVWLEDKEEPEPTPKNAPEKKPAKVGKAVAA